MTILKSFTKLRLLAVLITIFLSGCVAATVATVATVKSKKRSARELYFSDSIPEIDKTREARILTAFFGLDNDLPPRSRIIDKKAPGKDGMPLVFSLEIDPSTMDASDFKVETMDGTVYQVKAASFLPANEEFELRTILLIGEYGNYPDNPPMTVEIIGNLLARTGVDFKGQTAEIIPLEKGPVLSYAEYFTLDEKYPYVEQGAGSDCPKAETQVVVKAVWSGGVRAINGKELGADELTRFTITLLQDSDTVRVHPFQLADLDDNDNNTDLCISEEGIPILLEVKENTAIDPRDDKNPASRISVVSRW